jgi:hypothetical protein
MHTHGSVIQVECESADTCPASKLPWRGWNLDMRALTLLAMQRLPLEAGILDSLDTADVEYVRSRSADRLLRMAWRQRVLSLLTSIHRP